MLVGMLWTQGLGTQSLADSSRKVLTAGVVLRWALDGGLLLRAALQLVSGCVHERAKRCRASIIQPWSGTIHLP
jgi:hypothetical protein